ncbi:MAG: ABC transporter substrate-binding protein [Deinococcales bacterium]
MKKRFLALGLGILGAATLAVAQQGRTNVTFWYALGGSIGEQIEGLVKTYNASQDKVTLKAEYTGNYDDTLNKLRASLQAGKGYPNVVQVYDIGTRFMADSGAVVPLEDVAKKNNFDISKFVNQPRSYYTVDGKMYSLPFNSSNPLLYLNADAFKKSNLEIRPFYNLAQLEDTIKRLTIKNASGKTTRYGITWHADSWFIEQFGYNSGYHYCNNENGRKARATATSFNNPASVAFLEMMARLVEGGFAAPVGRDGTASLNNFANGLAAMYVTSTAGLFGTTRAVGGRFPIRTSFYPSLKERNGVAIGGASLWMLKGFSSNEEAAAWDFIRYMLEPATQGRWHLGTGYFPVIQGVTERPEVRRGQVANPNFITAIRQLETSKVNTVSAGCMMGQFTEIRTYVVSAWEEVLKGKPAKQALDEAKQKADAALARYNATVGK